jgi:O-antigen/teichoic acid export membrane protein
MQFAAIVRRLARGVAWNTLGGVIAQGGSFLGSIVLARVLGKQAFGEFAMVQSTVVALSSLAGLGLGVTATKYVSQYRSTEPARVGRILGLSSLVALAAAICFSIGFVWVMPSMALGAVYVLFITLNGYQSGALCAFESFGAIARMGAVYGLANVLLSWWFAVRWGLPGAILSQGAGVLLLWMLYQIALNRECAAAGIRVDYRGAWQERPILFAFSIPAAACGMVASVAAWWCNTILVRNAGYAELAIFSAAGSMRSMILFLPALVARVATPVMNRMAAEGDHPGFRRIFWTTVAVNGGIALLLAGVLAVAGSRVLSLFGKDFGGSTPMILLLLGSVVLEVVAVNLFQALFTAGRLWLNLGIICCWTMVLAVVTASATPRYGSAGLALAYLAAWAVSVTLYAAAVRQRSSPEVLCGQENSCLSH